MCDVTFFYIHIYIYTAIWGSFATRGNLSLIDTCDMTHSHMWRDSFSRVTWLIFIHIHIQAFEAATQREATRHSLRASMGLGEAWQSLKTQNTKQICRRVQGGNEVRKRSENGVCSFCRSISESICTRIRLRNFCRRLEYLSTLA